MLGQLYFLLLLLLAVSLFLVLFVCVCVFARFRLSLGVSLCQRHRVRPFVRPLFRPWGQVEQLASLADSLPLRPLLHLHNLGPLEPRTFHARRQTIALFTNKQRMPDFLTNGLKPFFASTFFLNKDNLTTAAQLTIVEMGRDTGCAVTSHDHDSLPL